MKKFKVDFSLDELELLNTILVSLGKSTSCKDFKDTGIDIVVFCNLCRKIEDAHFYMDYE